jgi:hypothetical protein
MTRRKPVEAPENPDDCVTREQKIAFQRRLRHQCEHAEKPFDQPWIPFDETRWWCLPEGVTPEEQQRRLEKQMNRYLQRQ